MALTVGCRRDDAYEVDDGRNPSWVIIYRRHRGRNKLVFKGLPLTVNVQRLGRLPDPGPGRREDEEGGAA